jgi:hypothetical protein
MKQSQLPMSFVCRKSDARQYWERYGYTCIEHWLGWLSGGKCGVDRRTIGDVHHFIVDGNIYQTIGNANVTVFNWLTTGDTQTKRRLLSSIATAQQSGKQL